LLNKFKVLLINNQTDKVNLLFDQS
jgi:hypothetical protein